MYYFRARWYDPETGRWLSKDPIGIRGGLNQYVAFGNNPINFIDSFGNYPGEYDSGGTSHGPLTAPANTPAVNGGYGGGGPIKESFEAVGVEVDENGNLIIDVPEVPEFTVILPDPDPKPKPSGSGKPE